MPYYNASTLPFNSKVEENIEKEKRKTKFLECLEGPRKLKTYPELRSECSKWTCNDIEREHKLYRDMCIHECISALCYYSVYPDFDNSLPEFNSQEDEDTEREKRKTSFKRCLEEHSIAFPSASPSDKKVAKSYPELRSECSAKICKSIERDDKFGRDLCLHKCVSVECFEMAYGDLDTAELNYPTPQEEEDDRIVRRTVFIECVEKDVPKNYEEKRTGCVHKGQC